MGISPKHETRCHVSRVSKIAFLKIEKFEKLRQRVSDFVEMPIPDGARPTIRRFLNAWFQSLNV
jgi:hypothetical protein